MGKEANNGNKGNERISPYREAFLAADKKRQQNGSAPSKTPGVPLGGPRLQESLPQKSVLGGVVSNLEDDASSKVEVNGSLVLEDIISASEYANSFSNQPYQIHQVVRVEDIYPRGESRSQEKKKDVNNLENSLRAKYEAVQDPILYTALLNTDRRFSKRKETDDISLQGLSKFLKNSLQWHNQKSIVTMTKKVLSYKILDAIEYPSSRNTLRALDHNSVLALSAIIADANRWKEGEDLSAERMEYLRSLIPIPEISEKIHDPKPLDVHQKRHATSNKRNSSHSQRRFPQDSVPSKGSLVENEEVESVSHRKSPKEVTEGFDHIPHLKEKELLALEEWDEAEIGKSLQRLRGKDLYDVVSGAAVPPDVLRVSLFIDSFLREQVESYVIRGLSEVTVHEARKVLHTMKYTLESKTSPEIPRPTLGMVFRAVENLVREEELAKKKQNEEK